MRLYKILATIIGYDLTDYDITNGLQLTKLSNYAYFSPQDSCTRNERQIFKEAGNQGERWYKASLTISSQLIPKDYRIMIKADVADPGFGDTSIDDLVIRKTQCPGKVK